MLGVLRRKAAFSTLVLSQSWYTGGVSNPKALGAFLQEEPILSHLSGSQARTFSHIASTGPMDEVKALRGMKEKLLPQIFIQKGIMLFCSNTGVKGDGVCHMKEDSFVKADEGIMAAVADRYVVMVKPLSSMGEDLVVINPVSDEDIDKYFQSFMPTAPDRSKTTSSTEERSHIIRTYHRLWSFVAKLSFEDLRAMEKKAGFVCAKPSLVGKLVLFESMAGAQDKWLK